VKAGRCEVKRVNVSIFARAKTLNRRLTVRFVHASIINPLTVKAKPVLPRYTMREVMVGVSDRTFYIFCGTTARRFHDIVD